jgi:hypothetical protein
VKRYRCEARTVTWSIDAFGRRPVQLPKQLVRTGRERDALEALRRAVRIPALSLDWQGSMQALLAAAETGGKLVQKMILRAPQGSR